MEKESIYRYIKLKQCAVQQQSKQHCKSTILQQKKKKKEKKFFKTLRLCMES